MVIQVLKVAQTSLGNCQRFLAAKGKLHPMVKGAVTYALLWPMGSLIQQTLEGRNLSKLISSPLTCLFAFIFPPSSCSQGHTTGHARCALAFSGGCMWRPHSMAGCAFPVPCGHRQACASALSRYVRVQLLLVLSKKHGLLSISGTYRTGLLRAFRVRKLLYGHEPVGAEDVSTGCRGSQREGSSHIQSTFGYNYN